MSEGWDYGSGYIGRQSSVSQLGTDEEGLDGMEGQECVGHTSHSSCETQPGSTLRAQNCLHYHTSMRDPWRSTWLTMQVCQSM